MRQKNSKYWNEFNLTEDICEWAKQNNSLVQEAKNNLIDFVNTGAMGFMPWMAGLFVIIHDPKKTTEQNKERYKKAIEILDNYDKPLESFNLQSAICQTK
jgi:hypothetical protein